MKVLLRDCSLASVDELSVDALALFIDREERPLQGLAGLCDWRLCGQLSRVLETDFFKGERGEALLMPIAHRLKVGRLMAFGLGAGADVAEQLARVFEALGKAQLKSVALSLDRAAAEMDRVAEAWATASRRSKLERQVLLGELRSLSKAVRGAVGSDGFFTVEGDMVDMTPPAPNKRELHGKGAAGNPGAAVSPGVRLPRMDPRRWCDGSFACLHAGRTDDPLRHERWDVGEHWWRTLRVVFGDQHRGHEQRHGGVQHDVQHVRHGGEDFERFDRAAAGGREFGGLWFDHERDKHRAISSGPSASTSSSATSSSGQSGSSGSGRSTGGTTGWVVSRVLATDVANVEVWNLTVPENAAPVLQTATLGASPPLALAEASNGELLVLTENDLEILSRDGGFAGAIELTDIDPLKSVAYVGEDGGPGTVIVCGGGAEAFVYPGASALDGGIATVTPLWGTNRWRYAQCAPGPDATILAAYDSTSVDSPNDGGVFWFDLATGFPHGTGTFAVSLGGATGVAMGPAGQVLLVGDDGQGNGFAALFAADGTCLAARAGGACTLSCGSCVSDPTLGSMPLAQAASLGDGRFLATVRNSGSGLQFSNEVLALDGDRGLAVSVDYQGIGVFSGGPQLEGLLAWPQAPLDESPDAGPPCTSASCPAPGQCDANNVICCPNGAGAGRGGTACLTGCDCGALNCVWSSCE